MLASIQTVAATIQTIEGYYPGSLAYRNNNPGNLIYAGQPGATPSVSSNGYTYASFATYADGYQALLNQIQLDANRGLSIQQFTNKYAPAVSGNDPNSYAQNIANAEGLSINDPLSLAIQSSNTTSVIDNSVNGNGDYTTNTDGNTDGSSFDLSNIFSSNSSGTDYTSLVILIGIGILIKSIS